MEQDFKAIRSVIVQQDIETLEKLLLQCPLLNAKYRDDHSFLHWAVKNNKVESIRFLLKAGADRYIEDSYGLTPYRLALNMKHSDCAEVLRLPPPPGMCSSYSISCKCLGHFLRGIML